MRVITILQASTRGSRALKAATIFALAASLVVVAVPSASAAPLGSACSEVGATSKIGKKEVICNQVGGQLILTEKQVTQVSITANAIIGGKNQQTANFVKNFIIPNFELQQALKGKNVEVNFLSCSGSCDDNAFKTALALDLLAKRGADIFSLDGFWVAEFADAGYIQPLGAALGFYDSVYNIEKIGNRSWQLLAGENGRNESFKSFGNGTTAMLVEGDYFWRSIINPTSANAPMADRNTNIGFAKIPSQTPNSGVNGQSFMSMSGGGGYAINQYSKNKALAWKLLTFMNSRESVMANMAIGGAVRITQRADVNTVTLKSDPCLKFVFENAIPNTHFRPAMANYNAVSTLLQKATTAVIQGATPAKAAADYETALKALVGADKVTSN